MHRRPVLPKHNLQTFRNSTSEALQNVSLTYLIIEGHCIEVGPCQQLVILLRQMHSKLCSITLLLLNDAGQYMVQGLVTTAAREQPSCMER
jgi:hypothetical protein